MIKLTSPSILPNRPEFTYEFHKEKLVVKQNSAVRNMEREVLYSKVAKIGYGYFLHLAKVQYWILLSLAIGFLFGNTRLDDTYPVIEKIGQVMFALGILFATMNFRKRFYVSFLDKTGNRLAAINFGSSQIERFDAAVKLIQKTTGVLSILDPLAPMPVERPQFEVVNRDMPRLFRVSTDRFYKDRVLTYTKGLEYEGVTEVLYSDLSEKITWAKSTNGWWCSASLSILLLALTIVYIRPVYNLFPGKIIGDISMILLVIGVAVFTRFFVKEDYAIFQSDEGDSLYGIKANKTNRATVEDAIEFVRKKVASANKAIKPAPHQKKTTPKKK